MVSFQNPPEMAAAGDPEAARLSGGIVEQSRLPDKGELPGIETGVIFHLSARRRKQFSG
jgi:hypothetical protein